MITPVCGSKSCEIQARKELGELQKKVMQTGKEEVDKVFLKMDCDVCKKPDAKRCAGCGQVAYCGKDCQKEAWTTHKSACKRRKLKTPLPNAKTSLRDHLNKFVV